MKKLLLCFLVSASLIACTNQETKKETEDPSMALFRENAKLVDASFKAYCKKDLTEWATYWSDTLKYHSAVYGQKDISKAEILERSSNFFKLVNNLKVNVNILPGVDEVTLKPDGSVRVYAIWSGDFANNAPKIDLKSYFSYKLDKDHKIYDGDEYFDVSGWLKVATANPIK